VEEELKLNRLDFVWHFWMKERIEREKERVAEWLGESIGHICGEEDKNGVLVFPSEKNP
jgi:hypothetical protein